MLVFNQNVTEMGHLHKTACAKIPDNLFLIHKLLIFVFV